MARAVGRYKQYRLQYAWGLDEESVNIIAQPLLELSSTGELQIYYFSEINIHAYGQKYFSFAETGAKQISEFWWFLMCFIFSDQALCKSGIIFFILSPAIAPPAPGLMHLAYSPARKSRRFAVRRLHDDSANPERLVASVAHP